MVTDRMIEAALGEWRMMGATDDREAMGRALNAALSAMNLPSLALEAENIRLTGLLNRIVGGAREDWSYLSDDAWAAIQTHREGQKS